jgi:hypothetical protein
MPGPSLSSPLGCSLGVVEVCWCDTVVIAPVQQETRLPLHGSSWRLTFSVLSSVVSFSVHLARVLFLMM